MNVQKNTKFSSAETESAGIAPLAPEAEIRGKNPDVRERKEKGIVRDSLESAARSPFMGALVFTVFIFILVKIILTAMLPESVFFSDFSFSGILDSLDLLIQWALNLALAVGIGIVWNNAFLHRGELAPGLRIVRSVLFIYRIFVVFFGFLVALSVVLERGPQRVIIHIVVALAVAAILAFLWLFYSRLIRFLSSVIAGSTFQTASAFPETDYVEHWVLAAGILQSDLCIVLIFLPSGFLGQYYSGVHPVILTVSSGISGVVSLFGYGLLRQYRLGIAKFRKEIPS